MRRAYGNSGDIKKESSAWKTILGLLLLAAVAIGKPSAFSKNPAPQDTTPVSESPIEPSVRAGRDESRLEIGLDR
jgi:hypothetical protein